MLGGLGGAVNASLCYLKLPVGVGEKVNFHWHLVSAGAMHGALLAVIAVVCASLAWNAKAALRWALVPVVGWLAGWISWIPLGFSIKIFERSIADVIFWPFRGEAREAILGLWQYFGLVSAIHYLLLCPLRGLADKRLNAQIASGVLSGVLGSLWWWIDIKPWYFSLVHGAIWGSLAGFGVWKSQMNQSAT